MDEHTLPLENGTLTYRSGGRGPWVVFSHALGPLAWGPLERLRERCTVAVPDWERSTVPPRTMGGLTWFEALLAHHGAERAALCAWSMAGPAAIHYAAETSAHLSHLILVDVAGLGPGLPPLRWRDIPHVVASRLRGAPTRGLVRSLWRNWVRSPEVETGPLIEASVRFFRDQQAALDDPTDDDDTDEEEALLDALSEIDVPTLVLSGRHSTVLGPRHGRIAASMLPHGTHTIFEESSHALPLEEPEKFQTAVAELVCGPSAEHPEDGGDS